MGTFPAFLAAWGPVDMGFGSGQGVKCYHSEHLYGELWHRAFIVAADTPSCNYLISCGNNIEAAGGVVGVWRHSKARVRGMKRVQVEPHLSITGACSAQWVPIRPKTDPAFLFALIHVLVRENGLAKLDIHRPEDLLLHLPLRYEDETRLTPIAAARPGSGASNATSRRTGSASFGCRKLRRARPRTVGA